MKLLNYDKNEWKYTYRGSTVYKRKYGQLYYKITNNYNKNDYNEWLYLTSFISYPQVKRLKYNMLIELISYFNGNVSKYNKNKQMKLKGLKIKRKNIKITF
tara:strand:- start:89 stop:391 length:303 start_codon:yes stop_codon:yes gene_type:complete